MVAPEAEGRIPGGESGPRPRPCMGMNGSSLAYMTPPAMAPGVVAYGAVAVPFYGPPSSTGG